MTVLAYEKGFEVTWSDLDLYHHMRNTAYSDYATHVRFSFFAENGFPFSRFSEIGVAPVIFKEALEFRREVRLRERVVFTLKVSGLAPDCSRWRLHHDVFREDGAGERVPAAKLMLEGAWMDLAARRVANPPPEVAEVFGLLPRTGDFEELRPIGGGK